MAEEKIKRQRRRRRKKAGAYVAGIILVMTAAVVIGVGMFFLISDIIVTGNELYTAEEIIEASGIENGKSIFLLNTAKAKENIGKRFAYVDEVNVTRELPGMVNIEITESYPIAWVRSGGSCWIIDKKAKLLEKTDRAPASGLVEITDIKLLQPVEGSPMVVAVEEETKLQYLRSLLETIFEMDMQDDISAINMSTATNLKFDYLDRFNIELGRGEDIADKLLLLKGVVRELEADERGTIDLSESGKAHFLPD